MLAAAIVHLAMIIMGENEASPHVLAAARRVTEVAIDRQRSRRAKSGLLDRMMRDPEFLQPPASEEPLRVPPARIRCTKAARVRAYLKGSDQGIFRTRTGSS